MGAVVMIPRGWDADDVADQGGRRFLVTGGTSGLGRETARMLTLMGAHVTITARDLGRARAVVDSGEAHDALELDLADLSSVRRCAQGIVEPYDVVILNAGVMWTRFTLSVDGFELQMATNHLGHFAFAGLLRERVRERLVVVSSIYHRYGSFGDGSVEEIERRCRGAQPYSAREAYGDSKLANLLFVEEVERRRLREDWPFVAVAAHPGWANTNLFADAGGAGWLGRASRWSSRILAQSAQRGALSQLCAATFPDLCGGEFIGPRGRGELRGSPRLVHPVARAKDPRLAANLWRVSEELTGVRWGDPR